MPVYLTLANANKQNKIVDGKMDVDEEKFAFTSSFVKWNLLEEEAREFVF